MTLKDSLEKIDLRTRLIYEKVKPNLSSNISKDKAIRIGKFLFNMSIISTNKKLIDILQIYIVSKLIFGIGLIKKYLGSYQSFYDKNNLESILIRLLFTLDKIVCEYDINLLNIKEKVIASCIAYYDLINDNSEIIFYDVEDSQIISNFYINKYESINLLELNNNIKHLRIFDCYLAVLMINKVFSQNMEIIDPIHDKELYLCNTQSKEKNQIFIKFLESSNDDIKFFIQSTIDDKKIIIENILNKYIDEIL